VSGLVVIGASYAGIQAALGARDAGYAEPVTVIGDEQWLPYERPPLSKDFLLDIKGEQDLILRDAALFANRRIDLVLGHHAIEIDRQARRVVLASGVRLDFDKLVIATGSHARRIPVPGAELDGICYLRSFADAIDLKARLAKAHEIVVIGGGFIGLEVASSAAKLGKKVTVIETAPRLLERAISPIVSRFLLDAHVQAGVDVSLGETVVHMAGNAGRIVGVNLGSGIRLHADLVVVGIGGVANDDLARIAGLNCSNGIVVDEHGRTEISGIYAAGIAQIITIDLPRVGSGWSPYRMRRTRPRPLDWRSRGAMSPIRAYPGSGRAATIWCSAVRSRQPGFPYSTLDRAN
jgi:3-phenylpropionate/trans-cinnamate dioxygenase ferredoxin reductase subunit